MRSKQTIRGLSLIVFYALLTVTSASVCADNRGSSRLISGDNSNAVNNFLQILRRINTFDFLGDNVNHQGCRRHIGQYVHRKGIYMDDMTWVLDCWEPTECTLVEERGQHRNTLRLIQRSSFPLQSLLRTQVNTVLLPIDERNTISYTFLPYVSQRGILFVTALLTGCSVFIATPDNINCNIIVMHANRFCRSNEPEDDDDNHKQATFVIQQVQSTNQQCRYQIQRRWSSDHKRANIERHNYHYNDNIVYYRIMAGLNFVYGYNLGGQGRRWQFCVKELQDSPRQEICHEII
ncbi:uncharacterized protein LOC123559157 [Mercenaria mercenaria]|uniref:uncharacterized protein LOC123559157 n=1 Tax=Mercenaria mercenaria TaxID=6596 RepID=UPI00234F01B1|nr:uncharacterized protein LOC123559157 [Mercenaria mercenaria]XP_053400068.1 uncharacterized protein LOC123559157 [Mercenaria mercenaria]